MTPAVPDELQIEGLDVAGLSKCGLPARPGKRFKAGSLIPDSAIASITAAGMLAG